MKFSKHNQRKAAQLNKRFPDRLVPMPLPADPTPEHLRTGSVPLLGWRSSRFCVVLWLEPNGAERLSVNRTDIDVKSGRWVEGITWDELQQCKSEAGYGEQCAVEIYPPDDQVTNVANMRHLWLLDTPPSFMWRKGQ